MRRSRELDLGHILRAQATVAAVPSDLTATVALEAGDRTWTSHIQEGRMEVTEGLPERPTVRIIADPETVAGVVTGARSGIEEFLAGRLKARGNLALALRLDSIFSPNGHHERWPRWRSVRARGVHTVYLEAGRRSGEHTSELQSRGHLVCRLL